MKFDQDLEGMTWKNEYESRLKSEEGLIVGVGNIGICVGKDKRYVFASHSNPIKSFCHHQGTLLYSVQGTLYDAVNEDDVESREGTIDAIESFNGKVYYAANSLERDRMTNEKFLIHGIYELGSSHAAAIRNDKIHALREHDGRLYDGGSYPSINTVFGTGGYHISSFPVHALETHGGVLYYAGAGNVKRAEDDALITSKDLFKSTSSLKSFNKHLLAGCLDCNIYSVFTDEFFINPVYRFNRDNHVYAIGTVPMALWETLAAKSKSIKR